MMMRKKILSFAGALLASIALSLTLPAAAQTPNYAVAIPGVVVIPFHVSGQYTATAVGVARFAMPFPARIVGVHASARASGGTSPTLTVNLMDDGASVLSAAITVTAGNITHGTVANPVISDESVMTVDLTIGGTSPTWNDITIFVTAVRE